MDFNLFVILLLILITIIIILNINEIMNENITDSKNCCSCSVKLNS
jgi:hypothetical protein